MQRRATEPRNFPTSTSARQWARKERAVALRLDFEDAIEFLDEDETSTFTWGVCEQAWFEGDLPMLRIAAGILDDGVQVTNDLECLDTARKKMAAPTPESAATLEPEPTATLEPEQADTPAPPAILRYNSGVNWWEDVNSQNQILLWRTKNGFAA